MTFSIPAMQLIYSSYTDISLSLLAGLLSALGDSLLTPKDYRLNHSSLKFILLPLQFFASHTSAHVGFYEAIEAMSKLANALWQDCTDMSELASCISEGSWCYDPEDCLMIVLAICVTQSALLIPREVVNILNRIDLACNLQS